MFCCSIPRSFSGDRVAVRGSVLARGSGPLAAAAAPTAAAAAAASGRDGEAPEAPEAAGKRKLPHPSQGVESPALNKRRGKAAPAEAATEKQHPRQTGRE